MRKPSHHLSLGFFLISSFVIFTLLVSFGVFTASDFTITIFLQRIIPDLFTTPFSVFSILGSAEFTGLLLLIIILLFPILRKVYIIALFIMTGAVELILKAQVPQVPPPTELLKTNIHLGFPSGEVSGDFFAYPSGHSGRTAFISILLIFAIWLSPKIGIQTKYILIAAIIIFDGLMFVSRIYLGEHWTTDVVGGVLLGAMLASLGIYIRKFKFR